MRLSHAAGRIQVQAASSAGYGPAMPSWRNIFEVAHEERLQAKRNRTTAATSEAVQATDARLKGQETPALSTEGLEVFEITVLDISLGE